MKYFVYIVKCSDNSFYTGFTTNIERRLSEHNLKKGGAKSVRGRLPVELVHSETFESMSEALKREREIKGWSRKKKIGLIDGEVS